ncbi:hypothetical protein C475_03584 [Halosimplex carlsbadense 2-9-1]|uniref:Ig-like domain-containing protein n=1 Tax=Halosimplex carlsbadense 2-9-1 TaxID=797114 RepID=M0D3J1_9EURY|nr:hypothetical protein [Halosimplex carlsbadense]ELZ29267.1 hypothetical protein C475_03584 [Halosimplex carlsbadense 2-9-1]
MRANPPSDGDLPFADRSPGRSATREPPRTEDIHLRNYDRECGYDLDVTVLGRGEDPVFESRYFCQPGEVIAVENVLPPGEYEVVVELDNRREVATECRVSSAPGHTVRVEVGNGTVSLTEGLY